MKWLLVWLPLFLCPLNAPGVWLEKESRTEASPLTGLVHQHIVFDNSATADHATIELARFSARSARLQLIDNPDRRTLAEVMVASGCLAGVNGGYFDENFAPLGWRVADGKVIASLRRARLFTGAIVSSGNSIKIVRNSELGGIRTPSVAVQCGPLLVDRGQRVAGLNGDRAARRTFAATAGGDQVMLGVCSAVSLADLAAILTSEMSGGKVQCALNLDGGSSSAFWFKRRDGTVFSIREQKNVRDFIGVVR